MRPDKPPSLEQLEAEVKKTTSTKYQRELSLWTAPLWLKTAALSIQEAGDWLEGQQNKYGGQEQTSEQETSNCRTAGIVCFFSNKSSVSFQSRLLRKWDCVKAAKFDDLVRINIYDSFFRLTEG